MLISRMVSDHSMKELMAFVGCGNRSKFRERILTPLLTLGLVEMSIPEKPNSSNQRYRLTAVGKKMKAKQRVPKD